MQVVIIVLQQLSLGDIVLTDACHVPPACLYSMNSLSFFAYLHFSIPVCLHVCYAALTSACALLSRDRLSHLRAPARDLQVKTRRRRRPLRMRALCAAPAGGVHQALSRVVRMVHPRRRTTGPGGGGLHLPWRRRMRRSCCAVVKLSKKGAWHAQK